MEITEAQYARIAPYLPVQRGNVSLSILYVACKWRGLLNAIYMRMNRWSKSGVLDRVFEKLQRQRIVRLKLEAVSLDSTIVKVHARWDGGAKKTDLSRSADPERGWTTKLHMVAAIGTPCYMRMNRWSKSGVLDRVFEKLQRQRIVRLKLEAVSLDSTIVKVHPDGTGALKKRTSVDRQIPRRLDHQASYGCRGCPDGL